MSAKLNSNTRRTALGAMLTALGTVLLYIGAVTEILDLSLCAAASLITVFAVVEFGRPYAYTIYTATVLLSLLILPNKFASGAYAFMAFYSIIKSVIERLSRVPGWIIKLLYFNAGLAVCIILARHIFLLPDEGILSVIWLFLLGNAAFILFDIAITKLITLYIFKLRARFKIDKYIKRMTKK